ncbi:MAG: 4-phosphoerythronate dehydrogenase [Fibromonadales bacterium]|nr:4-phosphoerythronate dehydrogenase [Fibromonadales bacterium]
MITIDSAIHSLHGIFEPHFVVQYLSSRDITKENLKDSQALIVRSTRKYGAETLLGTNVKFIGTVTSGFEHIDTDFCEQHGIFRATAHGSNAKSVAEYVNSALIEIGASSLGIVGVGATGGEVKKAAEKLGMKMFFCDPPKNLNDNIFDADIITLHCPLQEDTWHMANDEFFRKMKKGAWLINAARGAVCDSEALRRALQSGHLGGAVIDVWENEPNIDTTLLPLVKIATPHIAGHSAEAKINAANMIINAVGEYFKINIDGLKNKETANSGLYDIRKDDADFRKEPENFTKIRNLYNRRYLRIQPLSI